jgi:hypothetical protein
MSTAWQEYLHASNIEMRRNDNNRGLAYDPDPKALTVDLVLEYVSGFGWRGCGAREITTAVRRDERGVKRALKSLVDDGYLAVTESDTRGPKASKRKSYRLAAGSPGPTIFCLDPEKVDYLIEDYYGAGGGRVVHPVLPDC